MECRKLTEQTLGDIILCEPITRRGKEALSRLGLSTKEITPTIFYDGIRIESRFEPKSEQTGERENMDHAQNDLYYQYTISYERKKTIQERSAEFNSRFKSDNPNQCPLIMQGVAGTGKTIEVNKRIREITLSDDDFSFGKAYFDLEDAFTKKTYGTTTYYCPNFYKVTWLFCIKLLDGVMRFIKKCCSERSSIYNNFEKYFISNRIVNKKQIEVFEKVKQYDETDTEAEDDLYVSLIGLLRSGDQARKINDLNEGDADFDAQQLLEILMIMMYCASPERKQYIIFDNIEEYIKLNSEKIQIPNSDIKRIYRSIKTAIQNYTHMVNSIEENLGWKSIKIIIVLRRTSLGLLDPTFLQDPVRGTLNVNDITGFYPVRDIWFNKLDYVWDKHLKAFYEPTESERIINIMSRVMRDGDNSIGADYQSIIAPLMSYGLRRNARAQAHAVMKVFEVLSDPQTTTIDHKKFNDLLQASRMANPTISFMFRRALIEFQFKWSISSDIQTRRWQSLNIGHLNKEGRKRISGSVINIENVVYDNSLSVTFCRRILSVLSNYPDNYSSVNEKNHSRGVGELFSTISLFTLLKDVFTAPNGDVQISDSQYTQFAKVLLALADMSHDHTKSAPFVILGINDRLFHESEEPVSFLAQLLKTIWKAGPRKSEDGEVYNRNDYGVRLTDAGYIFLIDWHPSFSFMSALHCYTIPPLFFLRDIAIIKYVIQTVYEASNRLCKMYENEAHSFCGRMTLRDGNYLPKRRNEASSFKEQLSESHINHLTNYRTFLLDNYGLLDISYEAVLDLVGYIKKYINEYTAWSVGRDAPVCF